MIRVRTITDRARRDAADAERAAGIPDRREEDCRRQITLDLTCAGGRLIDLRPVRGKVAWNAWDAVSGEFLRRGSLKQLLHAFADGLAPQLGARRWA